MQNDRFRIYRHRLPHWRLGGATYFVTWRLTQRQPSLDPVERGLVCEALRHFDGERYRLDAFVVMDDHVHTLAQPTPGHSLEAIVHTWKSYSAHELCRAGRGAAHVWQDEYFDRIVRSDQEFDEKMRYIVSNPWKRWPALDSYRWVHPAPIPCSIDDRLPGSGPQQD